MALIEEEPPITLPRGHSTWRPSIVASGSAKYFQSCLRRSNNPAPGERDVNQGITIPTAGLQQQHARVAIGAEAVGQCAAGRSGTHDDVGEVAAGHDSRRSGLRNG